MAGVKQNPITYQLARITRTHFSPGRESRYSTECVSCTGTCTCSNGDCSDCVGNGTPKESHDEIPLLTAAVTFVNYLMLLFWGYVSDVLRNIGLKRDGIGKEIGNDVNTV